jgi:hypothetical protein
MFGSREKEGALNEGKIDMLALILKLLPTILQYS